MSLALIIPCSGSEAQPLTDAGSSQQRAGPRVLSLAHTACSSTKIVLQVTTAEVSLLFQGNQRSNVFAKSSIGQQEEQPQPSPGPKSFREDGASIRAPRRR